MEPERMTISQIKEELKELGVRGFTGKSKGELVQMLSEATRGQRIVSPYRFGPSQQRRALAEEIKREIPGGGPILESGALHRETIYHLGWDHDKVYVDILPDGIIFINYKNVNMQESEWDFDFAHKQDAINLLKGLVAGFKYERSF